MTVGAPERAWTDERLDDLRDKVDDGFAKADKKMDAGFAAAHKRMDEGFAAADKRMDAGFAKVDADIRDVRASLNQLMWGLLVAALGIIGTMIGTHAS
jgi:hypothetical protein